MPVIAWGLSFVLVVAWPVLTLPAGVFSKSYFTFWVVLLLVWVYYSAQILFFGAELAQVTATSRRRVDPTPVARKAHRPEKRSPLRFRPLERK